MKTETRAFNIKNESATDFDIKLGTNLRTGYYTEQNCEDGEHSTFTICAHPYELDQVQDFIQANHYG